MGRGPGAERSGDAHAVSLLAQKAAVLSFMAEAASMCAGPAGGLPKEAAGNVHRLAGLWESLSVICCPDAAGSFSLNAACAYELAGDPASAQRIAGRLELGDGRRAVLEEAVSLLLQRRFDHLRAYCWPIVAEPDYEEVEDIGHRLALASAAAALSDFAGCMLSGSSPEMGGIAEGLGDAERLFCYGGHHAESSLAHSARSLVGPMWSRSARGALDGGRADGAAALPTVKIFAKGRAPSRMGGMRCAAIAVLAAAAALGGAASAAQAPLEL